MEAPCNGHPLGMLGKIWRTMRTTIETCMVGGTAAARSLFVGESPLSKHERLSCGHGSILAWIRDLLATPLVSRAHLPVYLPKHTIDS